MNYLEMKSTFLFDAYPKSKEIREIHGEKEAERRKNKPDFDIDYQNQARFLLESELCPTLLLSF